MSHMYVVIYILVAPLSLSHVFVLVALCQSMCVWYTPDNQLADF
jgi:hypothetical protein